MAQERKVCTQEDCGFVAKPRSLQDVCPRCGSVLETEQLFDFEADLETAFPMTMTVRNAAGPSRKVPTEVVIKNEMHRDSGRWQQVHRTFDRYNDRYKERITDHATGGVVVDNEEPLSEHVNRGSARRKRPSV
jgi:hypothetical protein